VIRVLFLGQRTGAVRALKVVAAEAHVCGVISPPIDPDEGVAYESVHALAEQLDAPRTRATPKDDRLLRFAACAEADLVLVSDYRYPLPAELRPRAVVLHAGLLPRYRGRDPVRWAIINGERELGLTAARAGEGIDDGDVLFQERFTLAPEEDAGDALRKLEPLYERLTHTVLTAWAKGTPPREAQDHARASIFPALAPKDGRLDWNKSAEEVRNVVRAFARPFSGAYTKIEGRELRLWKASAVAGSGAPGEILSISPLLIACRAGAIEVPTFDGQPVVGQVCAARAPE
jgi:methionyl-tRNA formyltransferase